MSHHDMPWRPASILKGRSIVRLPEAIGHFAKAVLYEVPPTSCRVLAQGRTWDWSGIPRLILAWSLVWS